MFDTGVSLLPATPASAARPRATSSRGSRGAACAVPDLATCAAAIVIAAVLRKRRRSWSMSLATSSRSSGGCLRASEGTEGGTELGRKEFRLLPRREVTAFIEPVVVDELGIGFLRPTPRGLIQLLWKSTHGSRDGDVLRGEERELAFPIQTGGGD